MKFCFSLVNKGLITLLLTVLSTSCLLSDDVNLGTGGDDSNDTKPRSTPTTSANDYTAQYPEASFAHQIIESRSVHRLKNWLAGIGGTDTVKVITDHHKVLKSITILDGRGKPAAYTAKMGWIYHVYAGTCVVQGKCKEDWFLTGDKFDGVGTWKITSKTNNIVKALHGRDFANPDSFTETCPGERCLKDTAEMKALWLDLYDRYQKLKEKGTAIDLYWKKSGGKNVLVSQVAFYLYDFKIKNVSGTEYKNMKLIMEYEDGSKQQSYFTARPDRIVVNDVDTAYAKYKECGGGKDCFNKTNYPIAGLKYHANKSLNTGVALTHALPLSHNFMAVDANGDRVDTYEGTFEATIKSAIQSVTKNGVTTEFNIPDVPAQAVFRNGYGYIRTAADDSVTYPYATHTFVTILDDSLSKLNDGRCVKNQFRNTKWHGYGWTIDQILPATDIGCDTVLITKPRSLSGFDRTILNSPNQKTAYNLPHPYYIANNNYRNPEHPDMGDYWYTFAPAEIRVSHHIRDYFDDMTYYDNLDRNDSIHATIDINITAHNADASQSIALTYSSDTFDKMNIRPIDDPKKGLSINDLNISISFANDLDGDQVQFQRIPLRNINKPATADNTKAAHVIMPKELFEFGQASTQLAINLGRDPLTPKNPKTIKGEDVIFNFKEVPSSTGPLLPTNSSGEVINPQDPNPATQVVKSTGTGKATFYYAKYYIPRHTTFTDTATGEIVATYNVYCTVDCDKYPSVIDKDKTAISQYPGYTNDLDGFYLNQQAVNQGFKDTYGFLPTVPDSKQAELNMGAIKTIDLGAAGLPLTYNGDDFPYTYEQTASPTDKFGNNVLKYAGDKLDADLNYEHRIFEHTWVRTPSARVKGSGEWRGYGTEGNVPGTDKLNKSANSRPRVQ